MLNALRDEKDREICQKLSANAITRDWWHSNVYMKDLKDTIAQESS